MSRKLIVSFLAAVFALGFASCKEDEKSAEEYCNDLCDKVYDECSEEYMDATGYDEGDVEDALDECHESCEPDDSNEEYYDCIDDLDYPSECDYNISFDKFYDCELAADCDDLIDYYAGSGDVCEDEYNDAMDEYESAEEECNSALEDMDEDEYNDLMEGYQECYDDYYDTDA